MHNPHPLGSLYSTVPPLKSARLRSFHLDWRGPTLTLRIDLPSYPENPPPAWSELGHSTLQVHLQFLAIDDLTAHGWIPSTLIDIHIPPPRDRRIQTDITGTGLKLSFTLRRGRDDTLTVTVTSEGTSAAFQARTASLAAARVGLVSRSE
ncbi:Imm50 family immunity protein [Streptomyces sp. NPDC006261]|uniref:Imm50 family immunity protein n=1 Tax=Streptomyces sp. NPDC006261 TaxID=3156739 RepID=UPI0033AD012A